MPPFSCSCSDSSHLEPAVGGKSKRKRKREALAWRAAVAHRLASKSIPWRSLPYLRKAALADIRVVAKLYGGDLLDISPGESFLNLREARELLERERERARERERDRERESEGEGERGRERRREERREERVEERTGEESLRKREREREIDIAMK